MLAASSGRSGRKRKMGFGRKDKNAFSVHRSEEVMPSTLRHLVRQSSSLSSNEGLGGEEFGSDARGTERSGPNARAVSASLGSSNSSSAAGPTSKGGGSSKGSNSNSRKTSPSPRRGPMSGAPSVESEGDGSRDKDGYDTLSCVANSTPSTSSPTSTTTTTKQTKKKQCTMTNTQHEC